RAHTRVTISATLWPRHTEGERAAGWPESLLAGLHDAHLDEHGRLTVKVEPDRVTSVLVELVTRGVTGLTVSPASLEDLFLDQYDRAAPGSAGAPRSRRGER